MAKRNNEHPYSLTKKGGEHLLLIFPIVGTLFSVIGFVLLINKKVQNYLLRLPVSESI